MRACAVEMHVHTSQESEEPLYRKMPQPRLGRTQTNTLCEPAQSKCMSTCHKSQKGHFIQKFTGKMPRPRLGPECRRTLCASLRARNACQDFTRDIRRATLYGNLPEKSRSPDWAQNADTHFVRACAVEMHARISQEPLYTEFTGKMPQTRVSTLIKHRPLQLQ